MARWLLACTLWLIASAASAQNFPSRTMTIIVPFAPGASADGTARLLANGLASKLSGTVVVENRPGGGGVTGLQAMAKSPADGHTLAIGAAGAISIGPNLPGAVAFDPAKELTPVARLVDVPIVIVTNSEKGPKTLAELVSRAKSEPAGLSYGSTGAKSSQHLAVEFLRHATSAKLVHVAYRGSAPAVTDALGGQIAFASVDLTSAHELVKSGKLRALAVTAAKRVSVAPDIPTLAEAGFPGFVAAPYLGLFAPAGTPAPVLKILSGHVAAILAEPAMQTQTRNLSLQPAFLDETAFAAFLAADMASWRDVLKKIGPLE